MAEQVLGNLFGSGITDKIIAKIDDALEPVTEKVGAGAFETKALKLDAGTPVLTLFDTAVNFTAKLQAQAKILAPDAKVRVFDDTNAAAPAGTSFTQLDVSGGLGASASPVAHFGTLQLSGSASTTADFTYRHLLPVARNKTRLEAFTRLVTTTQIPQHANFESLIDGESLDFEAQTNVDFGLTVKYGVEGDFKEVLEIAKGLSAPITAHAQFSINAAFGLSLYDRLHVTVARVGQRNPGWVRIRVDRANRRAITASAAFALAVDFDAATGLNLLIDQIFARIPMPEVVKNLEEALALASDWDKLKKKISSRAAAFVTQLVGDTGWKEWLKDSPEVARFVKAANWIVTEYGQIDAKVRSVYEELLARLDAAGFAKYRALIHKVATFDLSTFDLTAVTSGKLKDVLQLIETLSGHDIEELLISGSVKEAIERAQAVARNIESLIDTAPDKAIEMINGFMSRTGVTSVVAWLKANATSVEALQKAGDDWIASIVERLTGKLLSQVSPDDIQKLKKFAAAIQKLLNAPDELKKRAKAAVSKLKGTFGVSLTLEWSRVSEFAAMIDFEIDPASPPAINATLRALPSGDVKALVDGLAAIKPDAQNRPVLIRDLILTSRHVRTSATALVISFLGLDRIEESRIDDTTIRIQNGVRSGLYLGGSIVRMKTPTAEAQGSAWLRHEGSATSLPLDDPYDRVATALRLAYAREDSETDENELQSIKNLLLQLGFFRAGVELSLPPAGQQTRFAMEIEFPSAAFDALVKGVKNDETKWTVDLLNAGARWFGDAAGSSQKNVREMAGVLGKPKFAQLWTNPTGQKFLDASRAGEFGVDIFPKPKLGEFVYKGEYLPLSKFVQNRVFRFKGFKTFSPAASTSPADLTNAIVKAAQMFATGGTEMKTVPLLNLLLVLARLVRVAPDMLQKATGLATLRSRPNDKVAWSDPQMLTLDGGIPQGIKSQFKITA